MTSYPLRLVPRAGIKLRRQVDRVRPRPCKIYFYFVLIFELTYTLDMSPLQEKTVGTQAQ